MATFGEQQITDIDTNKFVNNLTQAGFGTASGNTFTGNTGLAISLSDLNQPVINPANVPTMNGINPNAGVGAFTAEVAQTVPPAANTTIEDDFTKKLAEMGTVNPMEIQANLEKQKGLEEKRMVANNLANQINALNAEAQVAKQTLESQAGGKDVTTAFLGKQQQEIDRQLSIKSLPLTAQYQAALGDFQAAQSSVDKLFASTLAYEESKINKKYKDIEFAYQFATAKEKRELDAVKEKTRVSENNATIQRDAIKSIITNGLKLAEAANDTKSAGQILALDQTSPDFQTKLAVITSGIKDKMTPMQQLDYKIKQANLAQTLKETSLMGAPTQKEKDAEKEAMTTKVGQQEVLQDKLDLIGIIKKSDGLNQRVGSNIQSRTPDGFWAGVGKFATVVGIPGVIADLLQESTGSGQGFAGAVHRLANIEFIDKLINAKAQGATFGALNQQEADSLRESATQINSWEYKDSKGAGIGIWNIDEKRFMEEITRIEKLTTAAQERSTGTSLTPNETSLLNSVYQGSGPAFTDGSNYF